MPWVVCSQLTRKKANVYVLLERSGLSKMFHLPEKLAHSLVKNPLQRSEKGKNCEASSLQKETADMTASKCPTSSMRPINHSCYPLHLHTLFP